MDDRIVPDVVREHAEAAAFYWAQYHDILDEDPADPEAAEMARERTEANLDGLRIAGHAAWPFLIDQLESWGEKGEVFVAGLRAIEEDDARRLRQVLRMAEELDDRAGLRGAVAWAPPGATAEHVRDWLDSSHAYDRWLATAAFADHGADTHSRLRRLLSDAAPDVRAMACTVAARAGRSDAVPLVRDALADPAPEVQQAAAAALLDLGATVEKAVTGPLRDAVLAGTAPPGTLRRIVAAGPDEEVRTWFADLLKSPDTAPIAVRGAGMMGDPSVLPWLIRQMRDPRLADAAGRAFRDLVDIPRENWDDLTSLDPADHGPAFVEQFGDEMDVLPVANRITQWMRERGIADPDG